MNALGAAAACTLATALALQAGTPSAAARDRAPGARSVATVQDSFPHARHARLFTECESCHQGIAGPERASRFPGPDVCAGCHNGEMVRRVDWTLRPPRPTPLLFSHGEHPEIPCETCHAASDTAEYMQVGRAQPDRCLACHGGDAPTHLAQTSCEPCHAALPQARTLAAADIARFPKPPSHDTLWTGTHRQTTAGETCQVCHTRDFCASCHVNAGAVAPIAALASDERVASLVRGRPARYPEPTSHYGDGWSTSHGREAAADIARCANCHARESCFACHLEPGRVEVVARLPRRTPGMGPGVNLAGRRPLDHVPGFASQHRTAAAGGDQRCSRCHTPRFCTTCHDGPSAPTFHGADFVQRHSQGAYTRDAECASCHQPQAFCMNCHRQVGASQPGLPRNTNFHSRTNGGNWLFGHSVAARRSIESCATCHEQRFCLTCHSPAQGWGVSPHGPGFNGGLYNKNPAMCRTCHVSGPPRP